MLIKLMLCVLCLPCCSHVVKEPEPIHLEARVEPLKRGVIRMNSKGAEFKYLRWRARKEAEKACRGKVTELWAELKPRDYFEMEYECKPQF